MTLEEKEWTIMFYFASDNMLAPEIVSQLKSIKQAGFHPEANIIARFDPYTENTPTHIFDINRLNKLKAQDEADKSIKSSAAAAECATDESGLPSAPRRNFKIGYVGFTHNDPYIVDVMIDKIWSKEEDTEGQLLKGQIEKYLAEKLDIPYTIPELLPERGREEIVRPEDNHKEPAPKASLSSFLEFCSTNYPARHYMLFILGHGLVVGNDVFLFDEHAAQSSLTLQALGSLLVDFKKAIKKPRAGAENASTAQFELVGFHSCSMSSLEVAYELEGTANYMLASQGPAFVASLPYRQILIRVFNDLKNKGRLDSNPAKARAAVKQLLSKIFAYCHFNSYDFLVAGYSFDICLCDLTRLEDIRKPLSDFAAALIKVLHANDAGARERILLAHWDAQSHWMENYTDLYDFCYRLSRRCRTDVTNTTSPLAHPSLQPIDAACAKLMKMLEKEGKTSKSTGKFLFEGFYESEGTPVDRAAAEQNNEEGKQTVERFIIRSDFAGPSSQYSNGVSVYFPWAEPSRAGFLEEYQSYQFVKQYTDAKIPSWFDFLKAYFELTQRKTRAEERGNGTQFPELREKLVEKFAEFGLKETGQLNGESKPGANSTTGDSCEYQSFKNYPPFLRKPQEKPGANET